MDVKYVFSVRSLTNPQESFRLVLILPICDTFSINSQKTFLSADFCMQYIFSFDSDMF